MVSWDDVMTAPKPLPDTDYLRECFDYDPETGELKWRVRPLSHFPDQRACSTMNSRLAGTLAGSYKLNAVEVNIKGSIYKAHRLIWKMVYGVDPPQHIDHINGNTNDNRLDNLRCVSNAENLRNQSLRRDNTSGHVGVERVRTGRWTASATRDGVAHRLGTFDTFEEAVAVRKAAERRLGFHPNHGRAE